jgi:D-arabinose 1-dehydrogenase-like Zn-dependent alcohol dehydrogenase
LTDQTGESLTDDQADVILAEPAWRALRQTLKSQRYDLRDALECAAKHGVRPRVTRYPLERAGEALAAMHGRSLRGRAVLVMN